MPLAKPVAADITCITDSPANVLRQALAYVRLHRMYLRQRSFAEAGKALQMALEAQNIKLVIRDQEVRNWRLWLPRQNYRCSRRLYADACLGPTAQQQTHSNPSRPHSEQWLDPKRPPSTRKRRRLRASRGPCRRSAIRCFVPRTHLPVCKLPKGHLRHFDTSAQAESHCDQ